jgi:hypothetical protein
MKQMTLQIALVIRKKSLVEFSFMLFTGFADGRVRSSLGSCFGTDDKDTQHVVRR